MKKLKELARQIDNLKKKLLKSGYFNTNYDFLIAVFFGYISTQS